MFEWDEAKRRTNLVKHGLDFADAYLVYDDPGKLTFESSRDDEYRLIDLALVLVKGMVLSLVYVEQNDCVRVISFRKASREERRAYEQR
jgi:uncharacterized protein